MPSRQDVSTFVSLSRENKRSSKYLLASRWAPGGLEDKVESNDGSAFGSKALTKFRSATEPTEYSQIGKKDKNKFNDEDSSAMPYQSFQDSHTGKIPTTTNTKPTPRHIIDTLSEKNKVKMENPFLDLDKHKGLGSSRWDKE